MASLSEIRARLQAAESNKGGNQQAGGDNAIYPHWNIAEGASATLRFLPDGDSKNTFFWVERAMIKLPFNGIKGEMDSKQVQVQVPCVEMWGEACPIQGLIKDPRVHVDRRRRFGRRILLLRRRQEDQHRGILPRDTLKGLCPFLRDTLKGVVSPA